MNAERFGHFQSRYSVRVGKDTLPPVRLTVHPQGPTSFQDYLTPDEADRLGDALKAAAAEARMADEAA